MASPIRTRHDAIVAGRGSGTVATAARLPTSEPLEPSVAWGEDLSAAVAER